MDYITPKLLRTQDDLAKGRRDLYSALTANAKALGRALGYPMSHASLKSLVSSALRARASLYASAGKNDRSADFPPCIEMAYLRSNGVLEFGVIERLLAEAGEKLADNEIDLMHAVGVAMEIERVARHTQASDLSQLEPVLTHALFIFYAAARMSGSYAVKVGFKEMLRRLRVIDHAVSIAKEHVDFGVIHNILDMYQLSLSDAPNPQLALLLCASNDGLGVVMEKGNLFRIPDTQEEGMRWLHMIALGGLTTPVNRRSARVVANAIKNELNAVGAMRDCAKLAYKVAAAHSFFCQLQPDIEAARNKRFVPTDPDTDDEGEAPVTPDTPDEELAPEPAKEPAPSVSQPDAKNHSVDQHQRTTELEKLARLMVVVKGAIPAEQHEPLMSFFSSSVDTRQETLPRFQCLEPRLTAFFARKKGSISYSGITKHASGDWPAELEQLHAIAVGAVESCLRSEAPGQPVPQVLWDSALVNLYRTGQDYVSYHSDKEDGWIASFSLGATRHFSIRPKGVTKTLQKLELVSGDLVLMRPGMQKEFEHCVTKTRTCFDPRINVTFRMHHRLAPDQKVRS